MKEFKIKYKKTLGPHTKVTVFAGEHGQTKANCGTLHFLHGEWEEFKYLLDFLVSELRSGTLDLENLDSKKKGGER